MAVREITITNPNEITISREHWEALCLLEFAVREGKLSNLADALDYLHEVNNYPPEGIQPNYNFGLSTMTACGNVLRIAKEIQFILGEYE